MMIPLALLLDAFSSACSTSRAPLRACTAAHVDASGAAAVCCLHRLLALPAGQPMMIPLASDVDDDPPSFAVDLQFHNVFP